MSKQAKHHLNKSRVSGFTLMELIIVIIILGVMAVGIGGFITLTTQTYINVTERDELMSSARFSVERLNREIRNALPNSIRVAVDNNANPTKQCIEFVPISASTVYTELPVVPKVATNRVKVITIDNYTCTNSTSLSCKDKVIVYPLSPVEVYQNHDSNGGKVFSIDNYNNALSPQTIPAEIILKAGNINFQEYSPTSRAFIFNTPVSYCVIGGELKRYANYDINSTQVLPPSNMMPSGILMAKDVFFDINNLPFIVNEASLQRNAVVQINLNFTRDKEVVVFDTAIHIANVP